MRVHLLTLIVIPSAARVLDPGGYQAESIQRKPNLAAEGIMTTSRGLPNTALERVRALRQSQRLVIL